MIKIMPESQPNSKPRSDQAGIILNVIFHGPFIFMFYHGRLEVVTPVISEHLCGAGNWMEEMPCRPQSYYLTGVKPDTMANGVDDGSHALIQAADISDKTSTFPCYRFVLPTPASMEAVGLLELGTAPVFVGDYSAKIKAKKLGTAHVISYQLDPGGVPQLQLENLQWFPRFSHYYKFAINLHIFAESAFRTDPYHPIRDFGAMVSMLSGLSLGLVRPVPDFTFPGPGERPDLGIIREEQGGLRGLPPRKSVDVNPPVLCDSPSLVVLGAQDPKP